MLRAPKLSSLRKLLAAGAAVQLRAMALNAAFLMVTRTTQSLDATGVAAAAHAITIQLWQLGGVVLLALSGVAAILVPSEIGRKDGGLRAARATANRVLTWGFLGGVALGCLQLAALPMLSVFSPLESVQQAARVPSFIGAALQIINGAVFIGCVADLHITRRQPRTVKLGPKSQPSKLQSPTQQFQPENQTPTHREGIMQGTGSFLPLAVGNIVATVGMITSLKLLATPETFGLTGRAGHGVWGCGFECRRSNLFNYSMLATLLSCT